MKKLGKAIQYLELAKYLPLTLKALSVQATKWFIDTSLSVHGGMRRHTGGFNTLGNGCVFSYPTRQNLNTKILTESDLVGVSGVLPQVIRNRYFLENQG